MSALVSRNGWLEVHGARLTTTSLGTVRVSEPASSRVYYRSMPPSADLVEDRNWCSRCREYDACYAGGICPVCLDDDRRKALTAASRMASTLRDLDTVTIGHYQPDGTAWVWIQGSATVSADDAHTLERVMGTTI